MSKSARGFRTTEEPPPQKKRPRKRRCNSCGLAYDVDEIQPDLDETGRQVGYVCDNCI